MFKRIIKNRSATFEQPLSGKAKLRRIIKQDDINKRPGSEVDDIVAAMKKPAKKILKKNDIRLVDNSSTIKNSSAPVPTSSVQDDINVIIAEKTREIEERYKREKEQAYNDGYNKGREDSSAEDALYNERIENLLNAINREVIVSREFLLKNAEEIMAKLSIEIAEAVIGEAAMKSSNELLEYNLKRCLGVLGGSGKIKIKVSPNDYEFAKDKIEALFRKNRDRFVFEFEPDTNITPGGCYIESSGGAIDGRIESQFELVKDNFLQMI